MQQSRWLCDFCSSRAFFLGPKSRLAYITWNDAEPEDLMLWSVWKNRELREFRHHWGGGGGCCNILHHHLNETSPKTRREESMRNWDLSSPSSSCRPFPTLNGLANCKNLVCESCQMPNPNQDRQVVWWVFDISRLSFLGYFIEPWTAIFGATTLFLPKMDGSLNTGRFPGGLKTLVGLKDLLDLLQQQEERRRPKTASSVFSSEKFYWQQLGRRRGEKDARFFFFFPAVGLQATTAAVTNDKKRRKKKWLLSTISWLKKAFFLIFFTLLLIFQRFFNCNRRWWRRSRRNFKEDILAGDNLILLSSLHSRAFTSLPTV